ncbi:calcium homeostasis modulator 2-like protein [Labeo rohita]|uniref:Calcium homeostasis modulator 2-like protein n=1 Tax=Labeo rohita TaxID=84645 RepID=A0A498N0N2_LABRO|nr:calcium homeostasis modulator protein 2 [Labeo rohita]RXN27829.1 calcium homeostasis modulator 2-like protein [Labeo rohita]RXN37115.1 calcium homeostasis modulator 2-like protein [Labeo rohita]
MSAFLSEYIKFIALYFKSKDVVVFNGLVGLGTMVGQTAYNILAFQCPCLPKKNYLYGLTAIGVPALALFVIGVMLNQNTWDIVSECRSRRCRKLSLTAAFALLGSIVGRAIVAPVTWTVISLLRGEAYVCAFSEFMNPSSLDNFFLTTPSPEIMARFPCKDIPAPFTNHTVEVERQLKYESQLLGWLLVGIISLTVFVLLCLKNCFSPLGYQQEAYWSKYCSSEQALFQRTAEVHAKYHAAENVKSFFGFVALESQEKQLLANCKGIRSEIPRLEWNRVTGVYMYRETDETPIYSRLHKWAMYTSEHDC